MTDKKLLINELEKLFLKAHFEWKDVENPEGYTSGKFQIAWNKRTEILIQLVHAIKENGNQN